MTYKTATGEFAVGFEAGLGGAIHVEVEQAFGGRALVEGEEFAADGEFGLGAGDGGAGDDVVDFGHHLVAVG